GELKVQSAEAESRTTKTILANFQDTLGYIMLLRGDAAGAKVQLQEAMNIADDEATIFKYAVALYALGEKDEAKANLDKAVRDRKSRPSHELLTLRKHFADGPLLRDYLGLVSSRQRAFRP